MNPSTSRLVSRTVLAALLAYAATAAAQTNLTWDIAPGTAGAGDGSITGGNGNWNTTNGNWTSDAGANNVAWNNAANNTAIFGSTASTVTLDEAINLKALQANTALTTGTNYTFQGAALNFGTGGSISITAVGTGSFNTRARFTTPITGAPAVTLNMNDNCETQFSPSSGTMTLGAAGGSGLIALGGSTTGNKIASKNGKTRWNGTGSWELTGLAAGYEHFIDSGTLIVSTGTLRNDTRSVKLAGGTLHYNNPAAVNDARTNTGIDNDFRFMGGSLDNTRGTPITTSTYNPDMTWEANWTFVGSNGANSNLFIGTGDVRIFANVQVTVQNAATTFAVGGVVMNDLSTARSLTKAGDGTLELCGNNTYTGVTTVNAGTLAIPSGTSASNISIGASGTLQLTPGSTPSTTGSIDFAPGSKVRLAVTPTLPEYILFTSTGPMTGTPVIETQVPGYALFIDGRSLKFSQNADADSDGLPDWWELQYSTAVPPDNTSLVASDELDADGLTNLQEYRAGTHPNNPDTDADGLLDGVETNTGIWVSATNTGTDPLDNDTDNDSRLDGVETNTGIWVSSTNTGTNPHLADTDGDSYPDNAETNTGVYVSTSDTGTDPNKADTDGDGAGDWYEIAATFTNPSSASSSPGLPYPLPDPDASTGATNKPVKVFIMSGQSNMVGMGTVNGTDSKALSYITGTLNRFPNLINSAGNFIARQDVKYRGVISAIGNGPLAPGFGANSAVFGPELGFGQIMGWYHDEPVLLIKSSIGNRALGWDILPKGTPSWVYEGQTFPGYGFPTPAAPGDWYAGYEFDRFFMDDSEAAHPHGAAEFNVVDVLDNFATQYPAWATQGFEIAGFAWWQGDRDRYTMGHATSYETNLVKLITELRSYYSNRYPGKVVPNAPFVLATLGQTAIGDTTPESDVAIFNAQRAVDGSTGKYPQFAGNVKTVYAHPLSEGGASNTHYDGRAGTYMMVGDALGRAMFDLLKASAGPDVNPPVATSFTPANGAPDVSTGANLVANFNEAIAIGTGNITIHPIDNSGDIVIAITDATQVTVSGTTLTINPAANLSPTKQYAVQIDATAIDDLAGNSYAGITDNATWSFTTATPDTTDPTLSTTNPSNAASGVLSTANLVATFNESIAIGAGDITLRNLTDGSGGDIVIPVTDTAQVSISGSVLTVNPAANLLLGKTYAVQIAATAIDDLAGNSYLGILNDSFWSFTTAPPDLTAPSPDPMSFAVLPNALGETTITMTATTASDPSGVEYLFECTAGGGPDSGWQSAALFTPTGLTHSTTYSYTVKARDTALNEAAPSAAASATTASPDTTAPSPDPLTFASPPAALGQTSISMTATTASDPSGVQYFFECAAAGGHSSAWQDSLTYTDTGLTGGTQYTYKVRARDKSAAQTATAWSAEASATTPTAPKTIYSFGAKTWNTTTANWGLVTGGPYNTATWSSGDTAIFEGTAGTVTLGGAISIKNLNFTHTTGTYTLTGNTLNFTGGTITANNPPAGSVGVVIQSNITGSPALNLKLMDGDEQFTLKPAASGSMSIGAVTGDGGTASEKLNLQGGAGSSGTNASVSGPKLIVTAGAWTLNGAAYAYGNSITGGTLTLNANLNSTNRSVTLGGTGVINYNAANAVSATAATAVSGSDNGFRLQTGATLDQTSGAAINTSSTNPSMTWEGNWTFTGSNGANSNLNLGTGNVFLKAANPQVSVTNAATALTVGGVIANDATPGRGPIKAGAGTLELRGASTYTGATAVNAGTLKMGANNVIPNASNVTIGTATLDANTRTDTAGTLDVTGTAVINLGSGAALAFADSKAVDWTGGTLNITGTFVSGNDVDPGLGVNPGSIRFGVNNTGLTASQLADISVNGSGAGTYTLDAFGYLKPSGGGPGPVNSFEISAISSPQTVGTPITGITITAKDASNVTATSFTGTVTFGGTGGFTGTSASFTAGVLSGVSVIPTVAGSNLTFTVNDGASRTGSTTITTIRTQYQFWAGSAPFNEDANNDGVDNGMAWVLGAANPSENSLGKLSAATRNGANLRLTFRCLKSTKRGGALLKVQSSSDMDLADPWTSHEAAVPDADATVNGVVFDTTDDGDYIHVIADIPAAGAKLFVRLSAVAAP